METTPDKLNILSLQYYSYPDAIGGAWGLTYEINKRLVERKHRVHLITCKPEDTLPDQETIDGVEYYRIAKRHSKNLYRLSRALRKKLNQIFLQGSIDLIHIHNPLIARLVLRDSRLRKVPVVYHFHSSWYDEEKINCLAQGPEDGHSSLWFRLKLAFRLSLIRRMEHYCYRRSKSILFLSEYSKKHYLDYGGSRKIRLRVIPGGVDINFFHPLTASQDPAEIRSHLKLPAEGRLMLTVRRLEARMGLENLIIAASEVMHRRPMDDFHLLIAGKGSLEGKLRDLIRQQDVENRVHLLGLVPREQLPLYYRSADLFLLPTLALEGFGLATVEALASGIPAMGTRVGGTLEILQHIDDKLLFPGTDPKSLAAGLERFLNDPESFHALGSRCRLEVEEKYSWEKVVDRIQEEFILLQRK